MQSSQHPAGYVPIPGYSGDQEEEAKDSLLCHLSEVKDAMMTIGTPPTVPVLVGRNKRDIESAIGRLAHKDVFNARIATNRRAFVQLMMEKEKLDIDIDEDESTFTPIASFIHPHLRYYEGIALSTIPYSATIEEPYLINYVDVVLPFLVKCDILAIVTKATRKIPGKVNEKYYVVPDVLNTVDNMMQNMFKFIFLPMLSYLIENADEFDIHSDVLFIYILKLLAMDRIPPTLDTKLDSYFLFGADALWSEFHRMEPDAYSEYISYADRDGNDKKLCKPSVYFAFFAGNF